MKIDLEDYLEEDPFHPCLKCGHKAFTLNSQTGLYSCESCGAAMTAPEPMQKKKRLLKKRPRLEEDWE